MCFRFLVAIATYNVDKKNPGLTSLKIFFKSSGKNILDCVQPQKGGGVKTFRFL